MNKTDIRLLIVTQIVDQNDDVLGFFHRWLEVFSNKFERISVVCLKKGENSLPKNISVYSLGKENNELGIRKKELWSRLKYSLKFVRYIVQKRKDYDRVFVHMNQEYVLLGGLLWKLMGKKITMWRNHQAGNFLTRIAVVLSDKVFCTSPSAFVAQFKKTVIMPVGIDTNFFQASGSAIEPATILFFGRMDKIKRPDLFIDSLEILRKRGQIFRAEIVGNATNISFMEKLAIQIDRCDLTDQVKLLPGLPYIRSADMYGHHEVYVNLTPDGSMDKTIIEAMASGVLPVVTNSFFKNKIDDHFVTGDEPSAIAGHISRILAMTPAEKQGHRDRLRQYAVKNHSLNLLADGLADELQFLK
ncbi:MAG: glycosyltransferase family 4 protein [Candidatus Taylorbacteria bacterium]|nr:glycosyltransferase family 4 protein [Candidatus Taylorbacteria bacterium]